MDFIELFYIYPGLTRIRVGPDEFTAYSNNEGIHSGNLAFADYHCNLTVS